MAKYMLILRATDEGYAAMSQVPFEEMLERMGRYNEELIRAGVLLAAEGLDPEGSVVVEVKPGGVVYWAAGVTV